jgi:hypothetical protein
MSGKTFSATRLYNNDAFGRAALAPAPKIGQNMPLVLGERISRRIPNKPAQP